LVAGSIVAGRDHQLSERPRAIHTYPRHYRWPTRGNDAEAAKVFAAIAQETGDIRPPGRLSMRRSSWHYQRSAGARRGLRPHRRCERSRSCLRGVGCLRSVMHGVPDADPRATITCLAPMEAPATRGVLRPRADRHRGCSPETRDGALDLYKSLADDPRRAARPARPSGRNGRVSLGLIGILHRIVLRHSRRPAPAPVAESLSGATGSARKAPFAGRAHFRLSPTAS